MNRIIRFGRFGFCLLGMLSISACQNVGDEGSSTGKKSKSLFGGSFGDLPSDNAEGFITLTKVVRSNIDPNNTIELIGSNGDIGFQCPKKEDCSCVFNWIETNGDLREAEQPLALVEQNMARCLFSQVTPTTKEFKTRLRIINGNLFSNVLTVYMPIMNPGLDPSLPTNYLPISRFMCRDVIGMQANTKKYNGLLDPDLWDLSLAFNFYTTSLGQDYGATPTINAGSGESTPVPGWECPPIPNDSSNHPAYDLRVYSLAGVDLNNPSNQFAPQGDKTIFPVDDHQGDPNKLVNCPTGNEPTCEKYRLNRHDYYLSTFQSGVFKEPVCIVHRVGNYAAEVMNCTVPDTKNGPVVLGKLGKDGSDIIGFAAVPDANQKCPDSNVVKIPAGKKWAKVWQFRTSFTPRTIQDISNPEDINQLYCTTREKECESNKLTFNGGYIDATEPLTACYNSKNPSGPTIGFQQSAQLGPLITDPGFGNCDEEGYQGDGKGFDNGEYGIETDKCKDGNNGTNCCKDYGQKLMGDRQGVANFTPGGQWCNPSLIGSNDASSATIVGTATTPADAGAPYTGWNGSTVSGLAQDVWLMGIKGGRRACIEADTDANGKLALKSFPPAAANPFVLTPKPIDSDSKFDVIYVVTPESVTFENMQDPENNPIARQYTPYRIVNGQIQKYSLVSDSENVEDPKKRLSHFPLCVLQDTKKGETLELE